MKSYSIDVKKFVDIAKTKKKLYNNREIGESIKHETNFLDIFHPNASLRERLYYIEFDLFEIIKCNECGKITNWNNGPTTLCGSCVKRSKDYQQKTRATKLKLYGDETYNNSDKIYSTYIANHGNIGFANKTIKNLAISNYCTDKSINNQDYLTFSQIPNIREKMSKTINNNILKRFNNWVSLYKNPNKLNKHELSELFELINNPEWLKSQLLEYDPSILATKCGIDRQSFLRRLFKFGLYEYTGKSYLEQEMLDFCKSLKLKSISNTRSIINPKELDVYLPDYKLAIEMNGLFYHSSYSIDSEYKDYHLHKTQECEKQGIQLFHIFENEWLDPQKQKIWKSIISNRLGKSERIYARKTQIKSVSSDDKTEFLNGNHLQGTCSSSVNLGLYLEGELVSLMTFGKSRYDKKVNWELLRFCNKLGTSVVGGASRLLKAFRLKTWGSIISYADKRRSNGNLYEKLGFEFSHDSTPNYFYYKDQGLEHRIKYQKHKLKDRLDEFDSDLTESENMYNNGYRKIYDCGNQVWILN